MRRMSCLSILRYRSPRHTCNWRDAHHVPLDSEMNLFVRQCPGRIIGLTGSVGKTTTTSLLGSILQLHDPRTLVGGNIGGSLLDRLPTITPDTLVVLELSSFQLEQLDWLHYSPPLAVVLNLAPNHLDRHGTMEAYQQAKEVILAYQTPADTAVLNWDDPTVRRMATRGQGQRLYYSLQEALDEGVSRRDTTLVLAQAGACTVLCQQSDLCAAWGVTILATPPPRPPPPRLSALRRRRLSRVCDVFVPCHIVWSW